MNTDDDTVLRLLRLLPPRERLRVVSHVLPELEHDLPATPPSARFWQAVDIETLAERQGVQAVTDFEGLLGGWPEDETADDFVAAIREWRWQNPAEICLE